MNIEEYREYCLSLKATTEKLPFDEKTLVFYVMNKMFCLTNIDEFKFINLKCDPEKAIQLRDQYPEVTAGYHMNKKHWNSVRTDGPIPDKLLKEWIKDSYNLVIAGLPKKVQKELENL